MIGNGEEIVQEGFEIFESKVNFILTSTSVSSSWNLGYGCSFKEHSNSIFLLFHSLIHPLRNSNFISSKPFQVNPSHLREAVWNFSCWSIFPLIQREAMPPLSFLRFISFKCESVMKIMPTTSMYYVVLVFCTFSLYRYIDFNFFLYSWFCEYFKIGLAYCTLVCNPSDRSPVTGR